MSIALYSDADPSTQLSQSGLFTNPLALVMDGRRGGSAQTRLYVRNDDAALTYSGIVITPVDTLGVSTVDGTGGFSWKLRDGSLQPTEEQWDSVTAGANVTLSGVLNDTATYLPFWNRVSVPRNISIQTISDVILRIQALETLV